MKRDKDATIEAKVYKVYLTNEFKTGGSELRLIAWIVNGKEMPARLERRDYYVTAEGVKRSGKAKGFNIDDMIFLKENYDEIFETMKLIKSQSNLPPMQDAQPVGVGASSDDEVPFA